MPLPVPVNGLVNCRLVSRVAKSVPAEGDPIVVVLGIGVGKSWFILFFFEPATPPPTATAMTTTSTTAMIIMPFALR